MVMKELKLEELLTAVQNPENEDLVLKLLDSIDKYDPEELKGCAEQFEALFQLWNEDLMRSEEKANLCVKLAEKSILSSEDFRSALHLSVRKLLPPYLSSSAVIKAIGARDAAISVHDAALRLRKLQHLRSTAVIYQHDTRQWGRINGIDRVTGTIAVTSFHGNNVSSVPLATAVVTAQFFNTTPEFMDLLYPLRKVESAEYYRSVIARNALAEISKTKVRDIIYNLLVPTYLADSAFESWWEEAPAEKTATVQKRSFADARSILELDTLLGELTAKGEAIELTPEEAAKLKSLFSRIHIPTAARDLTMLAECISILSAKTDAALVQDMLSPFVGHVPFWPMEITLSFDIRKLDTWAHISAKELVGFIRASRLIYGADEKKFAQMAVLLPLRCLGPVLETISPAVVQETILKQKALSSDLLLWIWKFRKNANLSEYLTDSVDMAHVLAALSVEGLAKEWTAAQRELKKQLFEKDDFQKFVIGNANGDIPSIISALQKCRSFLGGERQSLMVKLAKHSEELTAHLEAGSAKLMMGDKQNVPEQAPITSMKSLNKLHAELEDLITRQIPENATAVAVARSYGDLRENAEYDAAKERRRFLHKRRADLEKVVGFITGTDFKDVVVKDQVVIGCQVKLQGENGEARNYFLLGAWDGDPERNFISYKTRIGEELLEKKVGDKITIPENGTFTITEILPLSEELRKELAAE